MRKLDNRLPYKICLITTILAFIVIMLGSYTRLENAGLGCPDWPGCYGKLIAPHSPQQITQAEIAYPGETVNIEKAWIEMVHRYLASALGILILIVCFLSFRRYRLPNQPIIIPLLLLVVLLFQALLGKWTVTMLLLPAVVMSHLLGGMAILVLLWIMALKLGNYFQYYNSTSVARFRFWAGLGLIIVILQIFSGGWTSANYAALICPDFPTCHGQFWPETNFSAAFNFGLAFNQHSAIQLLDTVVLTTIQMTHRAGALITVLYVGFLAFWILFSSRSPTIQWIAVAALLILIAQVALGILDVLLSQPLHVAVAHNGMAALLLLTMVTLNFALHKKRDIYSFR